MIIVYVTNKYLWIIILEDFKIFLDKVLIVREILFLALLVVKVFV